MLISKLLSSVPKLEHGFQESTEPKPKNLIHCHQVHGNTIHLVENSALDKTPNIKADGLTAALGNLIGIQTADCLPVLFAEKTGKRVAAVHAGWKGIHNEILPKAIQSFAEKGISPNSLLVAIGPAIGPCCFEVGSEIVELFKKEEKFCYSVQPESKNLVRNQATPRQTQSWWIDLKGIARGQLQDSGVSTSHIEEIGTCTYCGPEGFASYRLSTHLGNVASRQWSWIKI